MSQTTLSSREAGDNAESAVLQVVAELEYVPDEEALHYDARATTLVTPDETVPFAGICVLEAGTVVEIKTVMAVYGENQKHGRYYLRKGQHEALLDAEGVYLFGVCEPTPDRDVIALKVVPATIVDELIHSWISPDERPDYAQLTWTNVFNPSEVEP
ncbi:MULTISPECIES: hypothetical protein [Halorussus]|uniref:hypothetical protein n=1 Tax=Halorussus TaxID=1070314 RepID=UPI000E215107|nr:MULTISPECIES: hypothetical protein [Halorussus]NHN59829.1 hypothetical protein [Halorussus sp. JP-T4]